MPRTYDEDGQPMMSSKAMLKFLVKEIPVMYKDLRGQICESKAELKGDIALLSARVGSVEKKVETIVSDLNNLHLKVDRNHVTFIENQMDQEKRIRVLETARR